MFAGYRAMAAAVVLIVSGLYEIMFGTGLAPEDAEALTGGLAVVAGIVVAIVRMVRSRSQS